MGEVAEVENNDGVMDGELGGKSVGRDEVNEVRPIGKIRVAGGVGDVETVRQPVGVGDEFPLQHRRRRSRTTCGPGELEFGHQILAVGNNWKSFCSLFRRQVAGLTDQRLEVLNRNHISVIHRLHDSRLTCLVHDNAPFSRTRTKAPDGDSTRTRGLSRGAANHRLSGDVEHEGDCRALTLSTKATVGLCCRSPCRRITVRLQRHPDRLANTMNGRSTWASRMRHGLLFAWSSVTSVRRQGVPNLTSPEFRTQRKGRANPFWPPVGPDRGVMRRK